MESKNVIVQINTDKKEVTLINDDHYFVIKPFYGKDPIRQSTLNNTDRLRLIKFLLQGFE